MASTRTGYYANLLYFNHFSKTMFETWGGKKMLGLSEKVTD